MSELKGGCVLAGLAHTVEQSQLRLGVVDRPVSPGLLYYQYHVDPLHLAYKACLFVEASLDAGDACLLVLDGPSLRLVEGGIERRGGSLKRAARQGSILLQDPAQGPTPFSHWLETRQILDLLNRGFRHVRIFADGDLLHDRLGRRAFFLKVQAAARAYASLPVVSLTVFAFGRWSQSDRLLRRTFKYLAP